MTASLQQVKCALQYGLETGIYCRRQRTWQQKRLHKLGAENAHCRTQNQPKNTFVQNFSSALRKL